MNGTLEEKPEGVNGEKADKDVIKPCLVQGVCSNSKLKFLNSLWSRFSDLSPTHIQTYIQFIICDIKAGEKNGNNCFQLQLKWLSTDDN